MAAAVTVTVAMAVTMTAAMLVAGPVLLPATVMSVMGGAIMSVTHLKGAALRLRWRVRGGETGCGQQCATNQ